MKMTADSARCASFVVCNIPQHTSKAELSEELARCARGDGGVVDIQYILYPLGNDNKTALVNFSKYPGLSPIYLHYI